MSILNSTRINFFGGIEVDVSVPNNTGTYPIGKDGANEEVFDVTTSMMSKYVYDNDISDETIINTLRDPASSGGQPYFTNGGWNIYGQHSVTTNQATVRSAGAPGAVSTDTPLANIPFYLLGSVDPVTKRSIGSSAIMVDLNPLGSYYSQVALGGIMLGDPSAPLLHLQGDRIAGNNGLFKKITNGASDAPGSSMFAGTWQVTFDMKEVIASAQSSDDKANAFIKDFLATSGATGIVVSFSFFEMCPKMTTDQVRKSYGLNEDERNPSVGRIIGTIALAFEGETAEYPDGRLLNNASLGQIAPPAYAEINPLAGGSLLSVNMSLALQQENFRTDRDGYTSATLDPAIDAGALSLLAGSTTVSTIDTPDYSDYYLYGGIMEFSLSQANTKLVETEALTIKSADQDHATPIINLAEQTYRIFSSTIDVYMGEYAGDTHDVELQVRYLGKPVTSDFTFDVARSDTDNINAGEFLDFSTTSLTVKANEPSVTYTLKNKTGSDGAAGFEQTQFSYNDSKFWVYARKFQHTDFNIAKGDSVTWDQVYDYALRYHYLNFLGMSTVFPLNNAQQIQINGAAIKARTSSQFFGTTLYMPIVRSMSPSQVRLINAFSEGTPWDPKVEI